MSDSDASTIFSDIEDELVVEYVLQRWSRESQLDLPQKAVGFIRRFYEKVRKRKLNIKVGITGQDFISDKLGFIHAYVNDMPPTLNDRRKWNEMAYSIMKQNKLVQLSSKHEVNIDLHCISTNSPNFKQNLSELMIGIRAMLFVFNLCDQPSLNKIKKLYKECIKESQPSNQVRFSQFFVSKQKKTKLKK